MKTAIAIPARYGSTRFPGKPLAQIGGQSMLSRVVDVARAAAPDTDIFVTTEDRRIADHCAEIDVECIITPEDCPTGSDRVLAALKMRGDMPDFVLNLQGDAPFTPPDAIKKMIAGFTPDVEVITPVHRLSWDDLDRLRESKKTTPFSGTTAVIDKNGYAMWFSKNIIPAIRKENRDEKFSPVYQHIGLYGFRTDVLEKFVSLPQGLYEKCEGLEQLRLLENGITIKCIEIESTMVHSGIDTPEDLERAEQILRKN